MKNIVMDYNGTIIEYPDDVEQNKRIGYAVLDYFTEEFKKGKVWHAADILYLLLAKIRINQRLRRFHNGEESIQKIYEPFNKAIDGIYVSILNNAVDGFVEETIKKKKVNLDLLEAVHEAKNESKIENTGIISASYDYAIKRVLEKSGFSELINHDYIIANTLEHENGRVKSMGQNIYGRKADYMENEFFRGFGFREWNTYYIGDTKDDEPVAELLPPEHFIVSEYASDDFKEYMALKYKARVPSKKHDLKIILEG